MLWYSKEPSHHGDGSFEHPKHMCTLISKKINILRCYFYLSGPNGYAADTKISTTAKMYKYKTCAVLLRLISCDCDSKLKLSLGH